MNDYEHQDDSLCNASKRAVDALLDSSMDAANVPEQDRARAAKACSIFKLACGCGKAEPQITASAGSEDLIARTLAKIFGESKANTTFARAEAEALLIPDDEEALDALVAAGYRVEKVSSSLRARAAKIAGIGALVTSGAAAGGSAALLVERTLRAVRTTQMGEPRMESGIAGRIGGWRLADMLSLAAALVLGVSVLWPVLTTMRTHAARANCGANMASVASAMGSYASDYNDALPVATASFAGPTWWDVGTTPGRSNSANLFQLSKAGYAKLSALACPGNPNACKNGSCDGRCDWGSNKEVSYSYNVMFASDRPKWGQRNAMGPMVILADKSPVIARARAGEAINPMENSPNHGGAGEWGLRTDGSAAWLISPQSGDDNIWLPGYVDDAVKAMRTEMRRVGATHGTLFLNGNEMPASSEDTFVGP